ncbi:hypothetical protein BWI75_08795 [Gloeocapsopsis sp. AAB1 = 1H9]|uniref:Uncharacterized protein n=1 Tax=Gloeocapsopsis dulcis AAB1 = 1H9 TaxID=1433147 RepID=A0A6N8FV30_9CHRO|nr:hypothetical protein [Gloeocapsopsis dulcis AAB1 = 1H9]
MRLEIMLMLASRKKRWRKLYCWDMERTTKEDTALGGQSLDLKQVSVTQRTQRGKFRESSAMCVYSPLLSYT